MKGNGYILNVNIAINELNMDWIKVIIYTSSEGIEALTGRLYQLGINGIEIEDEKDFKDFLENNKQYWDYVDEDLIREKEGETKVNVYVPNDVSGAEMISQIRTSILEMKLLDDENDFGRLEIGFENMKEEDWSNNWKKYFHPIEIGKKLLIKPEWEKLEEETDRIVFDINPGMSFGTGSHHTTQLCLEALEKNVKEGDRVLDLGCGSGILSVISLMLGATEAVAVDIDPNATHTAYDNARRNGVDVNTYKVYAGNVVDDEELNEKIKGKYEIVVANIVADVIIGLSHKAKEYLKKGGVFITSGIIEDRFEDVKEALLTVGFEICEVHKRKDWVCIICR